MKKTSKKPAKIIRKTQQQRRDEAKSNIIRASFICLGKYGYHNTSLNRIADEAGCSKELPRYHFGSKESLVETLLHLTANEWSNIFRIPVERNIHGIEAFEVIFLYLHKNFVSNPDVLRGQLALILAAADPANGHLKQHFHDYQNEVTKSIKKVIQFGLPKEDQLPKTELDELVKIFFCFTRGMAFQWLADPKSISTKALLDRVIILMRHQR